MTGAALPEYEVYAIRYASRAAMRREMFMQGDPHDAPMDLDYYVWAIVGKERSFVVDLGFSRETAARRRRNWLRCPIESLRLVGLEPGDVGDAVISHLHYDHAGNFKLLPRARFHLQEAEFHFAAGRQMRNAYFRMPYEVDDLVDLLRLNFAERVHFYNGSSELAPGVSLHPMPGHTCGQQVVRVHTRRGWIVLVSDAAHYYEHIRNRRPFALAVDVPQMVESFDRIMVMAGGMDRVIPGHDPLVMAIYPSAGPGLEGIVARLDAEPDMAAYEAHWSR